MHRLKMKLKKLPRIILLGLSFFILSGATCQKKVDAYRCILINVDNEKKIRPLDQWYLYCVNQKTQADETIWIKDLADRCIRRKDKVCKWIVTDIDEEKIIKDEYERQCNP